MVELTAEEHVGAELLSIRLLTPARGEARAQAALEAAALEARRVGALLRAEQSPELDAAAAGARRAGAVLDRAELGLGYAMDRASFQLAEAGMTDFLLDGAGGRVVSVRGARDGGGGGWSVAVRGPSGVAGTARLSDRSLASTADGSRSVLGPSAATALALLQADGDVDSIRLTAAGIEATAGFARIFEPLAR